MHHASNGMLVINNAVGRRVLTVDSTPRVASFIFDMLVGIDVVRSLTKVSWGAVAALLLGLSSPAQSQAMGRLFQSLRRTSSLEVIALASQRVNSLLTFRDADLHQLVESSRGCALQVLRWWDRGPTGGQSEKVTVDAGDLIDRARTTSDSSGRLAIVTWDVARVGNANRIASPGGTSYPSSVAISIGQSVDDSTPPRRLEAIRALVRACEKRF